MDYTALLKRYIGMRVCMSLYGQIVVWGNVAEIGDGAVRLVDSSVGESTSRWSAEPGNTFAETVVHFRDVVAVSVEDPPEEQAEFVIHRLQVQLGRELSFLQKDLHERIVVMRERLRGELGVAPPVVRILDAAELEPKAFSVLARNLVVVTDQVVDSARAVDEIVDRLEGVVRGLS